MNKTEQAQQLRLAADILQTGHPFNVRHDTSEKWHPSKGLNPARAVLDDWYVRPALATPPDNRPLHNPDNFTAEQVGVGYRLCLPADTCDQPFDYWLQSSKSWEKGVARSGTFEHVASTLFTYRLPLSVPWPPPPVDPYTELKAAHAAGKVIQRYGQKYHGDWFDDANPTWVDPATHYRIKPEPPPFQLPPPPPDMRWHREDGWKEGDLPQGYRPHALGEIDRKGDQWKFGNQWSDCPCTTNFPSRKVDYHRRTTRPLVFTHEGKEWTYHRPGDPMPCDGSASIHVLLFDDLACDPALQAKDIRWDAEGAGDIIGWRYAETTKQAKLGPEDVPPLSVIRRKGEQQNWHWRLISYVHATHAICADRAYEWSELERDYEINRSIPLTGRWDPTRWEPCHKTISPR